MRPTRRRATGSNIWHHWWRWMAPNGVASRGQANSSSRSTGASSLRRRRNWRRAAVREGSTDRPERPERDQGEMDRIQRAIADDPALAVGSAKELIESTAKTAKVVGGRTTAERPLALRSRA